LTCCSDTFEILSASQALKETPRHRSPIPTLHKPFDTSRGAVRSLMLRIPRLDPSSGRMQIEERAIQVTIPKGIR
jgi:hypothetical protein